MNNSSVEPEIIRNFSRMCDNAIPLFIVKHLKSCDFQNFETNANNRVNK